jgi:diphosphomevalonate decarboxylase
MTPTSGSAHAQAHPNLALIKYWGKRNRELNLPATGSLSITLGALHTRTTVQFDNTLDADDIVLNGAHHVDPSGRISRFLDLVRTRAYTSTHARVRSSNNFPTGAGLASSASGFAALAVAASHALGLPLTARDLSCLARRGSGSAARSIFGGFVEMAAGTDDTGEDAVASPLLDAAEWPLEVVNSLTDPTEKSVGSSAGMEISRRTSPFYQAWVAANAAGLADARAAVQECDFGKLADVSEASCLAMHGVMLSSRPGLIYWNAATIECIHRIRAMRNSGIGVFFTIDAGPQVAAVCLPGHAAVVADALRTVPQVQELLTSNLGPGARVIEDIR